MNPAAPPPYFRQVVLAAVVLGMLVSVSSAQESALAMSVESLHPPDISEIPFRGLLPFTKEQEAAFKAQERAKLSAMESMATPRAIVLVLLSTMSVIVLVSSLQIRWHEGPPPVGLAKRLGLAAILSAVLRTMDGAQQLVIVRRAAEASGKALIDSGATDAQAIAALTRTLGSLVSIGWTVLMVGLFLAIASYFRSRKVLGAFDVPPEE